MTAAYASMNWETIVEDVCVRGLPEVLWEVAGLWTVQLSRMSDIAASLRDGRNDIENAWSGPAGRAYAEHLEALAAMADQVAAELKPVVTLLDKAAGDLHNAIRTMPIPATSVDDVARAHWGWLNHGCPTAAGDRAFYGHDSGGRVIDAGTFMANERQDWLAKGWGEFLGSFNDWWQEAFGEVASDARETLRVLDSANHLTDAHTAAAPAAPSVHLANVYPPGLRSTTGVTPAELAATRASSPAATRGRSGGGSGPGSDTTSVGNDPVAGGYPGSGTDTRQVPSSRTSTSTGTDTGGFGAYGTGIGAGTGGVGSYGTVGTGTGGAGGYGGGAYGAGGHGLGASGLAGISDYGATGLGGLGGTGVGGLGGTGVGGLGVGVGGVGGVGAGGGPGEGSAGVGAGRGLGAGLTPMTGIGTAAAGAVTPPGATPSGAAPSGVARPMPGGMLGGGAGVGVPGGDERSTWLTEDDDVWGTDSDAPPPLLC